VNQQDQELQLNLAFARCFRGADGEAVLDWLKYISINTVLGPDHSDAALRHREGQRSMVAMIHERVEAGRRNVSGRPSKSQSESRPKPGQPGSGRQPASGPAGE
jgi:hypothetical protein